MVETETGWSAYRRRVYEMLEGGVHERRIDSVTDAALILLIVLNAAAVILESDTALGVRYHWAFLAFEVFSVAVFTIEYAGRVWAAPEIPRLHGRPAWKARLRYVFSPLALIDLAVILPFYLSAFFVLDLRLLRLFRLMRVLKLTHYSPALATIARVARKELRSIIGALCILFILIILASAALHAIEGKVQPEAFGSISKAMWWAISTLTTVGYGDVVPQTPLGRFVGSIVMLLGIGVFVLWTSVFASGFIEETRKRSFVITWRLVSRVPVFAQLNAARIAEIAELLKPEYVDARYTILRRGEIADCMYFIAEGEVEVDIPPHSFRLGPGHFFGELALLDDTTRQASVTAVTACHLLRLERDDFRRLMETEPSLAEAVAAIARERRHMGAAHVAIEEVQAQIREDETPEAEETVASG